MTTSERWFCSWSLISRDKPWHSARLKYIESWVDILSVDSSLTILGVSLTWPGKNKQGGHSLWAANSACPVRMSKYESNGLSLRRGFMTWDLIICRSDYCHTTPSKKRDSTPHKAESVDRAVPHSHIQLVFFGCSTSLADNNGLVAQSLMDPLTLHLFAVASEKSKRSRGHGWVFLVTPNWWSLHLKEKEIGRWNRSGYLDGSYSKVTWGKEVILLDFEGRGKGGSTPERVWVWLTYCGQPVRHCLGKYTAAALIRRSLFIVLLISKICK